MVDVCVWALSNRVARVMEVEGTATFPKDGPGDNANSWDVTFRFDHGVPIRYVGEGRMPEEWRRRYQWISGHGIAFEGTDGWVQAHRGRISAGPLSLLKDLGMTPDARVSADLAMQKNFLESIRSRHPAAADIEQAVQSDIICIIADMAVRMGTPLRWDLQQERFIGNEEANRLRYRAMRSPWQV